MLSSVVQNCHFATPASMLEKISSLKINRSNFGIYKLSWQNVITYIQPSPRRMMQFAREFSVNQTSWTLWTDTSCHVLAVGINSCSDMLTNYCSKNVSSGILIFSGRWESLRATPQEGCLIPQCALHLQIVRIRRN